MPNEDFWIAVERLVAADDAGADIAALAEDLLDTNGSLGPQLQEAITCLDTSALGRATQLSDGMGGSDDTLIAVGCAVIAAGPMVYDEGVRDPESLVRPWDLSRGDLLLALNPGVTLVPVGESTPGRDPYTINLSIGDSAFGWPRRITEAVTYHQCRRQERNQRWRAIFAQHQFEHLIIHLSAAAGCPQKVGKPYSHHEQYLEVNATWDSPRSPFRLPEFVRTVLDAVATRLERTCAPPIVTPASALQTRRPRHSRAFAQGRARPITVGWPAGHPVELFPYGAVERTLVGRGGAYT